jgi:uncharacterized protein
MRVLVLAASSLFVLASCIPTDSPLGPDLQDSDGDGILDQADSCPNAAEVFNRVFDSDGCPDSPPDLYNAVRADVEAFWSGYFSTTLGRQYAPLRSMVLFSGGATSACGPGAGPFYCGQDQTVYLDNPFLLDQLQRIGDFAPAAIIAHEIGHHAQFLLGILGTTFTIAIELQADCLAGRWAGSAGARGLLDIGDMQEAYTSLFQSGDAPGTPWFHPNAHGTPLQRQQAFAHGVANGAC